VDTRVARLAPLLVWLIALAVYVRTLLPGIAFGDWGEMQTVSHVLGVAHPTGYPTYVIVAWLAQLVPVGTVAWKLNLLSAVCIATALATVAAVAGRLGVRPVLAVAAALATGAVGTVWAAATVAEVNPLHLTLMALLLHRAVVWEARRATRDLVLGGLLVGLALGNHLLTLFVAPFVVLFAVWAGRRELLARPWLVVAAAVAGLAGLAVYAYIPLAAGRTPPPALPYNHPTTLEGVWWLVSGQQFRGQFDFLSSNGPAEFVAALPALRDLALERAAAILPILGLLGIALLVVRRTAFGLACAGILLIGVYIWANYLQLEHYLLVPWLVLGVGATYALEQFARGLVAVVRLATRAEVDADGRARLGAAVGLVSLAFSVVLTGLQWSGADRSGEHSGDDYVEAVLSALPRDAAILSYWDASTPLWHAEYVQGRRPDVLIVDDTNIVYEGWGTRENRIAALICQRPVFLLRANPFDIQPTESAYRLTTFLTVRVALGGPTADVEERIYQVTPRDSSTCG
jgi:hypothetical protein